MHKHLALALVVLYIVTLTAFSLINLGGIPSLGSSFDDKIYHFAWVLKDNWKDKYNQTQLIYEK